jgi:transposase
LPNKKEAISSISEAIEVENTAHVDIDTLVDMLTKKDQVIEKKSSVIEEQKKRIEILEEYLRLERARRFGASSEQNPHQEALLFDEAEAIEDTAAISAELETLQAISDTPKKRGRKGLSKNIPRHQVHINLSEEEKAGAVDTFYSVTKEELDIVPAKVRVIEYLQEKAVFVGEGTRQIKAAALPKHPLNKCIASISLLAYIIVSKYCDGLPLYGLEVILKRYGGEITRTSMANWAIRLAVELQPLINLAREHQLSYDYLQIDKTRIKVLKELNKSPRTDK